jgi:asparagine synthase (glutamine-hydrolysing)
LYTRVRAQGIRACLDGLDGDSLLANTSLAQWLWRRGQWRAALGETLLAQGQAAYFNRPGFLLYRSLRVAMVPEWLRQVRRSLWRGKRLAKALQVSIINPEFARRVGVEERLERFDAYDPPSNPASQTEAHRISFNHPHLQAALERYDRVASIYAIEPRHPLLDVRLAEFCLDLPWQLKTQRGWTKRVMRQAMQPYLPGEVVWRRDKDHLGWLLNVEILKARPGDYRQVLDEGRGDLRAYVDMGKIERAWGEFFSTGKDEPARWLWEAIALAQWLRHQKETLGMLRTLPKGLLE